MRASSTSEMNIAARSATIRSYRTFPSVCSVIFRLIIGDERPFTMSDLEANIQIVNGSQETYNQHLSRIHSKFFAHRKKGDCIGKLQPIG
jgi:hypothetical protein